MSFSKFLRLGILSCIITAPPAVIDAQLSSNGAVSGAVTAPDGASIPTVKVVLSGADGAVRSASTSADGSFLMNDLPSGTYTLKADFTGFAPYVQTGVAVATGRTTHVLVQLSLATAQQVVNVTTAQTTFDTTQTSSVVNIDRDRVEELPIPNRNYLTFVLLS